MAASGPINVLSRHMKRGLAITVVYGAIVFVPLGLAAVLLPSLINATIKVGIEEWGAHRERHAALPEPDPSG